MPISFQSTPPVKAATNSAWSFVAITEFQSTPPVKAATRVTTVASGAVRISIHAAREGGDAVFSYSALIANNFNPRRP